MGKKVRDMIGFDAYEGFETVEEIVDGTTIIEKSQAQISQSIESDQMEVEVTQIMENLQSNIMLDVNLSETKDNPEEMQEEEYSEIPVNNFGYTQMEQNIQSERNEQKLKSLCNGEPFDARVETNNSQM